MMIPIIIHRLPFEKIIKAHLSSYMPSDVLSRLKRWVSFLDQSQKLSPLHQTSQRIFAFGHF